MNTDVLKGNWKQAKGKIKEAWGKLTDDELDQIEGDYDQFVGKVQERYGYSKDEAARRVNSFIGDLKDEPQRQASQDSNIDSREL